ncbi:type I-C CRISPR-associated protein Cas8c/Csd1 [Glycomyces buryatensis]|nr:type I-C CRISPR-associated protein Cas8c/Csd1 [Glycomyces buryatensis]
MVDEQDQDRIIRLDEDRTDRPYVLGRIIALIEETIRAGTGERARDAYKETHWPDAVAGRARRAIVQGEQKASLAMKALRHRAPKRAAYLERTKSALFGLIDEVPEHLGQHDSLILNLGYQHQSADLRGLTSKVVKDPDTQD